MQGVFPVIDPLATLPEPIKHSIDAGAVLGAFATALGLMPEITAFLTAVWICLRLYECLLNIRLKRRELDK